MAKTHLSSDHDQYDSKVFKESLGSFGTTTRPGDNQLSALQTKVRQGVKHVELHLASKGKGQFNQQDVPDKYGFEQRRTIMQLAKLNKQTLSVHGSFDIVSFSGLSNKGFDEAERLTSMKEIDETLKFAAETAKGGAVVFHLQGEGLPSSRSEPNISKKYLDYLKNNKDPKLREEYNRIKKDYFDDNPLNRRFVDNPEQEKEVRQQFEELRTKKPSEYQSYVDLAKKSKRDPWEEYYIKRNIEKQKLSPDLNPLIVVGDKIDQVQRQQDFIDLEYFKSKKKNLSQKDLDVLETLGVNTKRDLDVDNFQKVNSIFTNGLSSEYKGKVSQEEFESLRNKLLIDYGRVLKKNHNIQAQADKEFFEKFNTTQIELAKMQREELRTKYSMYKEDIERVKKLEEENKIEIANLTRLDDTKELDRAAADVIRNNIAKRNNTKNTIIYSVIGQNEFHELQRYDESVAQLNKQIKELDEKQGNIESVTDAVFEKNTGSIAHLGIKALRYQLDLKKKAEVGSVEVAKRNKEIKELEAKVRDASTEAERNKLNADLMKKKYQLRDWTGTKDYDDIDLIERPLYLAPENMLPGYGTLSSLEEYKGTIRMAQEDFAKRILSGESEYKQLREEYEKETGLNVKSHEDALKLAKRHIGGTFDNAHAAAWLKHFKREEGESDEHRLDRFNVWLNTQAEEMVKDGVVKHIHFNDSQGKDDDHNLLGQGILDIHDLRDRLRKAGLKEPLIVEAGGRGGDTNMHLLNAFEIFNPTLAVGDEGYKIHTTHVPQGSGTNVSDWVSVERGYNMRPQYSQYGMGYSTFRHQPPQQGQPRGDWSGTGFL